MTTIELQIAMDNNLIAKTRELAIRHFGDDSDASLAQVLELAFRMRLLWSRRVKLGQEETDEAISQWQFPKSLPADEDNVNIRRWLFRRM